MNSPQDQNTAHKSFKNILVAIPQLTDKDEAELLNLTEKLIDGLSQLAQKVDTNITLFTNVYSLGAELDTWLKGTILNNMHETIIHQQKLILEQLEEALKEKGVSSITSKVVWKKHLDDAIEEEFKADEVDLVIKPSDHHFFAAALMRNPDEWRLIRLDQFPVYLLQVPIEVTTKVILAIDVSEESSSNGHNLSAITQAKSWCDATGSELHLLNAFPSAADLMAFAPAEWTVPQIQETLEKQHRERLESLANHAGVPVAQIHVGEGQVAQAAQQKAEELGAGLLVITSRCRKGVPGFFIGNTAETFLEYTKMNVLVLKPQDEED